MAGLTDKGLFNLQNINTNNHTITYTGYQNDPFANAGPYQSRVGGPEVFVGPRASGKTSRAFDWVLKDPSSRVLVVPTTQEVRLLQDRFLQQSMSSISPWAGRRPPIMSMREALSGRLTGGTGARVGVNDAARCLEEVFRGNPIEFVTVNGSDLPKAPSSPLPSLKGVPSEVITAARAEMAETVEQGDLDDEAAEALADAIVARLKPYLKKAYGGTVDV